MKFVPILKERVWGGSKLVKQYNKELPRDEEGNLTGEVDPDRVGESWEISGMGDDNESVVAEGYLADNELSDILETYMGDLVGENIFDYYNNQFPLLVKILNVEDRLSVQVHPDDATAFERYYLYGKDECWYVMDASPDAKIYMGFNRDITASEFYERCKMGTVEEVLNVITPHKGDFFYIKAGTVHACGGGLTIAEVQEPSDLTFRLYDWGREHNPRTARQMHLEEAIDCIDYKKYDDGAFHKRESRSAHKLADCEHFTVNCIELDEPKRVSADDIDSCLIYICTEGCASFQSVVDEHTEEFEVKQGGTILIPASVDDFIIVPKSVGTVLLETFIRPVEEAPDNYLN